MNNAEDKILNTAGIADEGMPQNENVAPVITEDNLFDLVESGEISLEQANEFLESQEGSGALNGTEVPTANENPDASDAFQEEVLPEGEGAGVPQGQNAPFRVFDTEEDFQRTFDTAWNKRYGKMMRDNDAKDKEHQNLLQDLGALLGVSPENAAEELKRRKLSMEAQKSGENPELYAARVKAEEERDLYKSQLEKQRRQAQVSEVVGKIRAQGESLKAKDPTFDIDSAMQNPAFSRIVMALFPSMPDRAVEIAYSEFKNAQGKGSAVQAMPPVNNPLSRRPVENGVAGGISSQRKPIDFSRMSDKDILALQDRIMNGEKIDI